MKDQNPKAYGFVHLIIKEPGNPPRHIVGRNLIVANLAVLLANSFSGISNNPVHKIGFGTGITAPIAEDIALENLVIEKTLVSIELPVLTPGSVQCNFFLEKTEAIGSEISEVGLFTSDDILIARKVIPPFIKTAEMEVSGFWVIQF